MAAGKIVTCPACDASISVPVSAASQVIDVQAEPLNDPESEPEISYEDDPFFNPEFQRPPRMGNFGQTIWVQRGGDGSGCCLVGCLALVLFAFLAIRGFFSLF